MPDYRIDQARDSDTDFIRDSWRRSYRDSPRTGKWPPEAYSVWVAPHMDALLARSQVRVARPADWPEGVIAWVAAEQTPEAFVLHYAFTKPLFRSAGVMTALVQSLEPKGARLFSQLRPPFTDLLKQSGFAWTGPREASHPR